MWIRGTFTVLAILLGSWAVPAAGATTYTTPLSPGLTGCNGGPGLTGCTPGPDRLVGTADDVFTGGSFNTLGSPGYTAYVDSGGGLVAYGAGSSVFTFENTNGIPPLGFHTEFNLIATDPGFGGISIDDDGRLPHHVLVLPDHTYFWAYTILGCLASDPSCIAPQIETDFDARGVWWAAGDDLDSIPAFKSDPFLGDLRDYARFVESISGPDAAAYSIRITQMAITASNVRGSLVDASWVGGAVIGVTPSFTIIPEPSTALLLGTGLLALGWMRRAL